MSRRRNRNRRLVTKNEETNKEGFNTMEKLTTAFTVTGTIVLIADLLKYIPGYEKNKDCFILISDKTELAVKNATKLRDAYEGLV